MNEETENILQQITNERNITLSSKRLYWNAVEQYEQVQGLPLKELLEEAEKEACKNYSTVKKGDKVFGGY